MDLNLTSSLVSSAFSPNFQDHLIHSPFQSILWVLLVLNLRAQPCSRAAETLQGIETENSFRNRETEGSQPKGDRTRQENHGRFARLNCDTEMRAQKWGPLPKTQREGERFSPWWKNISSLSLIGMTVGDKCLLPGVELVTPPQTEQLLLGVLREVKHKFPTSLGTPGVQSEAHLCFSQQNYTGTFLVRSEVIFYELF